MKQLIKAILLLLATFGSGPLYAKLYGQAKIDSLLKELPNQKEDTNKVNVLHSLAYGYNLISNFDEGIKYGLQNLELATKLNWGKGWANMTLAYAYQQKLDNQKALEYYSEAERNFKEKKYSIGVAAVNKNCALGFYNQGNYPRALEYYLKALESYQEAGDKQGVAGASMMIGNIYVLQKDYVKALKYQEQALKISEEINDKSGMAYAFGNIGTIYNQKGDYVNALEYYFKDLKLEEELENKRGMAEALGNVGNVFATQKDYLSAITYGQRAIQVNEEVGDKSQLAYALAQLGESYLKLVEDTSIGFKKPKSANEMPAGNYIPDETVPVNKKSRLYNAILYLNRGLDTAKKVHAMDIMQSCYQKLAAAYKLNGDYAKSIDCYQNFIALTDSVFSEKSASQIARIESQKKFETDSLKSEEARRFAENKYRQQRNYTYVGIAAVCALIGFSFFIIKERKKTDKLLLNILPLEVATELKNKGSTHAKHYENVTVLFTDFVNFTEASERMKPQTLIEELHNCFKKFDEITGKYNIEKIKTIGDAYMAVCGLPTADPKHAENIVRAATEINAFMQDRLAKLGNSTFEVRIGIHSGSVVAGIVGVKKFAYDIWGDTVNTAARMEQNSEPGRINISQTTYELVKDKFNCEYRGEIDAKGKGMLKMYYMA